MNRPTRLLLAVVAAGALGSSPLGAQVLHVNDRWKNCAMVIDPSLTQEAWHQFVREVGLVVYFRPLASARPLGPRHFELGLVSWSTRIDDADPAWNDTFSHPDSTHWLMDGSALPIPGLVLRAGVTERVDVGAYFTKSIGANYGMVGGQAQYNVLSGANGGLAAAGKVSAVRLFGPEDLSVSVYGLELVASRSVSVFAPYAGVSGYLSRGREHTSKVDLQDENVFGLRGAVGVAAGISALRLGAELNLARVPGYAFKIAFGS